MIPIPFRARWAHRNLTSRAGKASPRNTRAEPNVLPAGPNTCGRPVTRAPAVLHRPWPLSVYACEVSAGVPPLRVSADWRSTYTVSPGNLATRYNSPPMAATTLRSVPTSMSRLRSIREHAP